MSNLAVLLLAGCGMRLALTVRSLWGIFVFVAVRKWRTFRTHIVLRFISMYWHTERRQVKLPADDAEVPPCVKLHGLLPAPQVPPVLDHEPELVHRAGVHTVWTDGSGRYSSDPQHRRCGVGCYADTQERAWLPLPGIKQSVYRAEFLAVAHALE
eukprot:1478513-Amphidinium_carterae.1